MKIVGFHLEPGAVGWHRVWCWTDAMKREEHTVWHRPHAGTQFQWPELDNIVRDADVVIAGRMHNAQVFAGLLAGRKLYGYKLIVDTDDHGDAIPTYNQAYADYHSGAGTARLVRAELREADLVTVSTERLADWVKKYSGRVVVIPNVIDTRLYAKVRTRPKEPRHRDDRRIYWGGGGGHYDDLLVAKSALLRIFRERPNVKLVFSNFVPDWAVDLPNFRVFMIRFAQFNAYPKVLKAVNANVAIAPLVDNEFNRCKSNVKYLGYAMADIPAVYQDLEPYDSVIDGLTGFKARTEQDWYERISLLLDEPTVAASIAHQAKRHVLENYTIDMHVPRYEAMLKELVNARPAPELTMLQEGEPIQCQTL